MRRRGRGEEERERAQGFGELGWVKERALGGVPAVQQHLLLNIPVGATTFPLRAALLGDQSALLLPTLAEPVIILQEGLAVGLMKPLEKQLQTGTLGAVSA